MVPCEFPFLISSSSEIQQPLCQPKVLGKNRLAVWVLSSEQERCLVGDGDKRHVAIIAMLTRSSATVRLASFWLVDRNPKSCFHCPNEAMIRFCGT